jgi:hypothetical protein
MARFLRFRHYGKEKGNKNKPFDDVTHSSVFAAGTKYLATSCVAKSQGKYISVTNFGFKDVSLSCHVIVVRFNKGQVLQLRPLKPDPKTHDHQRLPVTRHAFNKRLAKVFGDA